MKKFFTIFIFSTIFLFSNIFAATPAITGKQIWKVTTGGDRASLEFRIYKSGEIKGIAYWSRGPNTSLTGHVNGNDIFITRHLRGSHAGRTQVWTGVFSSKNASGIWTGTGGGGKWWAVIH